MTFTQKMFSFEGRIGRKDFWIGTLIIWGISTALLIVLIAICWAPLVAMSAQEEVLQSDDPYEALRMMGPLVGAIGFFLLFQLAIIWPSLALCVKRLHDRDQSGWLVMIFVGEKVLNLIPFLGTLVWLGVRIWWLVNLGILEGSRGPNQYGLPANEEEMSEVFA